MVCYVQVQHYVEKHIIAAMAAAITFLEKPFRPLQDVWPLWQVQITVAAYAGMDVGM